MRACAIRPHVGVLRAALVSALSALPASFVTAQGALPPVALARAGASPDSTDRVTIAGTSRPLLLRQDPRRAPWWAPIASALVPGAGQAALGQQRAAAYFVADVYIVAQALSSQRAGNSDRDRYREIAANVARRPFSTSTPVGSWGYYEILETQPESGVFSKTPGVIDPETDPGTFNGATWQQAREINWVDPDAPPPLSSPEYQRALAFYESRAIRDEFRWSWRNAGNVWGEYRSAVTDANRNYKRAVRFVGMIGANHLASLVDAYVTVRIRRFGGAGVEVAGLRVEGLETNVAPGDLFSDTPIQLRSTLRLSFGAAR